MVENFPNESPAPHLVWHDTTYSDCVRTCGSAGPGIILAGIAYPLVLLVGVFAMSLANGTDLVELGPAPLMLVLASLSVCPIAALVSFMIASLIIPAFNAASGFPWNTRTQISLVGGLAGFLPFSWLYFIVTPRLIAIKRFMLFVKNVHLR